MFEKIRILQLGSEDWRLKYQLPDNVDFSFEEKLNDEQLNKELKKPYDLVFLDKRISKKELSYLQKATKAYTLFVTDHVNVNGETKQLFDLKKGQRIAESEIQEFLLYEVRNYFPEPYGEKFQFSNLAIAQDFSGSIRWDGNYSVVLQGEFGEELTQIAFWRNNIPVFQGQAIELWLEYKKDPGVEIALSVTQFVSGSLSEIQQTWDFSEKELDDIVLLDNQMAQGVIFVSLQAKGEGTLEIIALHDRYSRRGHGCFLPGGERYVTQNREEVFAYFEPGDRKPPLNVYFSGYKTKEGFEGYRAMRNLGCPFLLISEARLEGGGFYMGSEEYEKLIKDVLRKYMDELGFSGDQVILSGLSMGTYGALYYGCDIMPHAMILGKPLASIGDVAANEKLFRPGVFPTSLDVLHMLYGDTDHVAVKALNDRFWDKFDGADWSRSKFIVAYMIEDDYDATAYKTLISHLWSGGVQLYGKGIHGRHNDDTGAIVSWFFSQYRKVLHEDFPRKVKN